MATNTVDDTTDEPTCPNGFTLCPVGNPTVPDDRLMCFNCRLNRAGEV